MLSFLLVPATLFTLHTTPLLAAPSHVAGTYAVDSLFPEVTLEPTQGALLPLLAVEAEKARKLNRTPVIDVSAPWCGPCKVVDAAFQRPEMKETMKKMYLIHLNLDLWKDTLTNLGVDVAGIPRVVALDAMGKPSGEPWRPRDIPADIRAHGQENAFQESLLTYCETARTRFTQKSAAGANTASQSH